VRILESFIGLTLVIRIALLILLLLLLFILLYLLVYNAFEKSLLVLDILHQRLLNLGYLLLLDVVDGCVES
jgi:hypothetical protein